MTDVGSINFDIESTQLAAVFSPFGAVTEVQMIPNPDAPGKHRGYGFIEYNSHDAAKAAVENMNGFVLAGREIKVGNPLTDPLTNHFNQTFNHPFNQPFFSRYYRFNQPIHLSYLLIKRDNNGFEPLTLIRRT